MTWVATVASVAVASMASMVGVDGGLGSSTQRALTWKSLCVPSSEFDTHSSSLLFAFTVCRMSSGLSLCLVGDSLLSLLLDRFGSATCVSFHRFHSVSS